MHAHEGHAYNVYAYETHAYEVIPQEPEMKSVVKDEFLKELEDIVKVDPRVYPG